MRVSKKNELSELIKYGFKKILKEPNIDDYNTDIQEEEYQYYGDCHDYERQDDMFDYYEYALNVGHARRGQSYYILIDKNRIVHIWASKPDGDGSSIQMPDALVKLINDGVFVV